MAHRRLLNLLCGLAASLIAGPASALVITDWTSVDSATDTATGTLDGVTVTLSGGDINFAVLDGTGPFAGIFSPSSIFSPPIAASDSVQIEAISTPRTYTIAFSTPVTDPFLYIASLATSLTFTGTTLTKISGQGIFDVSSTTVTGQLVSPPPGSLPGTLTDANGLVQLNGTFSSISFDAVATFAGLDGTFVQVAVIPEPSTFALLGLGLAVLAAYRRN